MRECRLLSVASGRILTRKESEEVLQAGIYGAKNGAISPHKPHRTDVLLLPFAGTLYSPVKGILCALHTNPVGFCLRCRTGPDVAFMLLHGAGPLSPPKLPARSVLLLSGAGARVSAGQVLARMDLGRLRAAGLAPFVLLSLFSKEPLSFRVQGACVTGGQSHICFATRQKGLHRVPISEKTR